MIDKCHLKCTATFLFHITDEFWNCYRTNAMYILPMYLTLSNVNCGRHWLYVGNAKGQGFWICGGQWLIPWKLIVTASLRRGCLSVNARKLSWLEQTAALWSRLSPALDTSHIVPRPPAHPCLTHRLRLLDLRNLTLRLLAAPPGTCQPFTPSLAEHLEGEEGQTRRPGWAVVKPGHGNR